ncbi:MAG TPA: diguanylate cyclase [Rhodocyclaceae bacterium]|nr:diguanylate cyclase [Rhodocyclaceae bacterium]HMV19632.1 diguanylate cyclase [Rhodocyclaceae bacterium]HMW76401.1 diguanylate cyclase [Rhodocyclaceae bacterium]HNE41949.1 diguanylate cyclase [Rhodocyclaceae bacterium]HNL20729.1 diguanylate cyclase [Rhodocyclaceae bacterium]
MSRLTLSHRLLLLGLLPSALLAVVLVTYFTFSGIKALDAELRERGLAVVRYLAPISEYGVISGNLESLQNLAQTTVQQPGVKATLIIGRSGRTLAVSGRVSLSSEQLRRMVEGPGLIADNEQWVAFGAPIQRTLADTDVLFDAPAMRAGPEVIGQIFVEFDKKEVASRQDQLLQRGLLIVAAGLSLVCIAALWMAESLTHPVERLVKAVRAMTRGEFEYRVQADSGAEFGELERGFNDMAERIAEVHRTMQERIEEATAQLAFQARHDPLTGLVNRREFETRLEKSIATAQAGGGDSALLYIDLDRFKPVNDTCGHLAGDELLRQISRLFQGRLREEDTLARIGGDEFGVLLNNCSSSRALQVAEDFCAMAAAYRFIWHDKIFTIGASIGLASITRLTRSVAEALTTSDAACYSAKEQGRNRVHTYSSGTPGNRRHPDLSWQERIRTALADDVLAFEAHPLRCLGSQREPLPVVEIRARLDDRSGAPVPMAVLVDAAERYGLSTKIDQRIAAAAIAALGRACRQERPMRCLLPLSASSVRSPELLPTLVELLAAEGIGGSQLGLMISEETAVRHSPETVALCAAARQSGCTVILSDFGGGFASFSHLHSIRPDGVRISRSLTRDVATNRSAQALVRAVEEIARDLAIETIAEGIDDLPTAKLVEELGITYIQGRVAGPVESFADWVEGTVIRGA